MRDWAQSASNEWRFDESEIHRMWRLLGQRTRHVKVAEVGPDARGAGGPRRQPRVLSVIEHVIIEPPRSSTHPQQLHLLNPVGLKSVAAAGHAAGHWIKMRCRGWWRNYPLPKLVAFSATNLGIRYGPKLAGWTD